MLQTVEFSLAELLERAQAGQIPPNARVSVTYDDAALVEPATAGAAAVRAVRAQR